ncbi:MAG: DNA polymerase III subunit alpha [Candidatus Uhrbacteria bacterium]
MSKFVHLHVHSHYSLLDGLTRIDELVEAVKADGQTAVALTDHGTMYGAIEFYQACRKAGIKPIVGVEAYLAPRSRTDREPRAHERAYHHLVLLAKNRIGYQNLLELTTRAHLEGFYYKPRIDRELLEKYGDGLIVLSACLQGDIPQFIVRGLTAEAEAAVRWYRERFGPDFYLELQRRNNIPELHTVEAGLIAFSKKYGIQLVATNDSHYLRAEDAEAHDVLLCLQTKVKQSDRDRMSMMGENYSFRSARDMALLFEDIPEVVDRTLEIAEKCNLDLELGKILLPKFPLPRGETEESYLRSLCTTNIPGRYPDADGQSRAAKQLEHELATIGKMGLSSYFLIVQDFVNWSKSQGIIVGPGRGSAAGSIVSYLLNITNLDPLAYGLLFERFLTPGRIQMPDIDIDFADHRRDEVIRYVEGRYGKDRVAQIITFGTMAARASIRDVGRVLDVPLQFCDRLAKLIPLGSSLDDALRDVPELKTLVESDETTQKLITIAKRLEGVARHSSTHACGVVISAAPLVEHVPIQHASADDATIVTQYEMHAVEALGLLKMDFLGLSNLSIIEHAVRIIREHGDAIDVDRLPSNDAATFQLLQRGETTGVFQLESGGMKRYLKELKPSQFEDIIAMVALYRPGPMELIPEYVARKLGHRPVTYLHPKLESILKNTYGILVYQEQLMQLARELAGFSLSEADTLRKAVGKKIKSLLDEQRGKLVQGMIDHGMMPRIAEKIWEWIEPFARYGFNRSHAACYAFIAYQTAYLKAHYPAEFMAALLTAERGDTDRLAVLIQECREMGISVLGPDVNTSAALFMVVDVSSNEQSNNQAPNSPDAPVGAGKFQTNYKHQIPNSNVNNAIGQMPNVNNQKCQTGIRFGLAAIKNVGEHIVEALIAERARRGQFRDLADLLGRIQDKDFNRKSLECLIRSGAFDQFGERGVLLANIETLLAYHRAANHDRLAGQNSLFGGGARVELRLQPADPALQRLKLGWEKELLGLYLSAHPFTASMEALGGRIATVAAVKVGGEREVTFGGVVARIKRIVTKKGDGMLFAEVEDASGSIEVVVFPRVLTATTPVWLEGTLVLVRGKCSEKDGVPKVLADRAVQLTPGAEGVALSSLGQASAMPNTPIIRRRIVINIPEAFPADRLHDLQTILMRHPGAASVELRLASGRTVRIAARVTPSADLTAAVEPLIGLGSVREEDAVVA